MRGFTCGILAALLLCFSPQAMAAASAAVGVFASGVLPALFPMMVLSRLISPASESGRARRRGSRTRAVIGTILFAFAAGSPASAQRAQGFTDAGGAERGEMTALLAVTGVMSPMFFVGTLAGWTGQSAACWLMLAAHWMGALLTGGLCALVPVVKRALGRGMRGARGARGTRGGADTWDAGDAPGVAGMRGVAGVRGVINVRDAAGARNAAAPRAMSNLRPATVTQHAATAPTAATAATAPTTHPSPPPRPSPSHASPSPSPLSALPDAVSASACSLLAVCGSMMLFSIVAGVLETLLATAFPVWALANRRALSVLWALLEIGGGAAAVTSAFPSPPFALLCVLCSFGGLSIWLQNLLFVGKSIRPAKLLCVRALHGALALGVYAVLNRLFPAVAGACDAQAHAAQTYAARSALWVAGSGARNAPNAPHVWLALAALIGLAAVRCRSQAHRRRPPALRRRS